MKKLSLILASLWLSLAPAVAQTLVPNLGAASAVSDTDLMAIYQGASPLKKVTGAQVKTYANTSAVRATTTTSEALANSDQNKLVTFSNAGAVACTIAQAGSGGNFAAGWAVSLKNLGAGTVTCTPTTSTVDGAANFTLTTGQGVDLYSDGTNYFTQPGKGGSGTVTTTSSPANGNLTQFSGASSITNGDLSGDCITGGTLATTCGYKTAGYVASNWYVPQGAWSSIGAQATTMAASTISCTFGAVPKIATIGAVGAAVSTLAASGNFQIAIYANSSSRPGALIGNTGSLSTAAVGTITGALAANKQIGPGGADGSSDVWWCTNVDASAGGTVKFISVVNAASTVGPGMLIGSSTAANVLNRLASSIAGVSCAGANCTGGASTFGSWPATLAGSTWTDITSANVAIPVFQPASVP